MVEVVFWELKIPCLGLATVLCRAPAAGLTGSDRDGGFQEGKTHDTVFKYIYVYMFLLLKLHGKNTDLG